MPHVRTAHRDRRTPALTTLPSAVSSDELLDELTSIKGRDRSRMFRAWHECGVSVVQLSAANLLEVDGPMSMGRLAESLGISVASATGVVDRMEERNLVVRRHDVGDRRLVIVHAAEGTDGAVPDDGADAPGAPLGPARPTVRGRAEWLPDRPACPACRPRADGGGDRETRDRLCLRTYLRALPRARSSSCS